MKKTITAQEALAAAMNRAKEQFSDFVNDGTLDKLVDMITELVAKISNSRIFGNMGSKRAAQTASEIDTLSATYRTSETDGKSKKLSAPLQAEIDRLELAATNDLGFFEAVGLEFQAQRLGLDASTFTNARNQSQREAQDRLEKINVALQVDGKTFAEISNIVMGTDTHEI